MKIENADRTIQFEVLGAADFEKWLQKHDAEIHENAIVLGYEKGRADMQKFVEKSCTEIGIDYTLIFTCEKG